jgi:hypothetical protein
MDWTMRSLVPEHLAYVRATHETALDRTRAEIEGRLNDEIAHWQKRLADAGAPTSRRSKLSPDQIRARLTRVEQRLELRRADLDAEGHIVPRPPRILSSAVVVPAGALGLLQTPASDLLTRAVEFVMAREDEMGRVPERVGTGSRPAVSARADDATSVWIDVRLHDPNERTLTMTRSEVLYAKNLGARYRLALATVSSSGQAEVRYVGDPFSRLRVDDFQQHAYDLVAGPLWRAGRSPF